MFSVVCFVCCCAPLACAFARVQYMFMYMISLLLSGMNGTPKRNNACSTINPFGLSARHILWVTNTFNKINRKWPRSMSDWDFLLTHIVVWDRVSRVRVFLCFAREYDVGHFRVSDKCAVCFALFTVVVYSLIGYLTVLFGLPSVYVLLELVLVSELCVFLVIVLYI